MSTSTGSWKTQDHWIIENTREFQKNIYFCFIDYAKAIDSVDHNKLCKILKEMGIPDHFTCLLRNLYAGQEATVRTRHGTTDWFQIEKGVYQGCILSPCLFNLYAEYIMRNAGLEEAQAGIKTAGRNIDNLRYVHDTTLMAESEEELRTLLMKVKESEKVGLKLNIQKTISDNQIYQKNPSCKRELKQLGSTSKFPHIKSILALLYIHILYCLIYSHFPIREQCSVYNGKDPKFWDQTGFKF